MKDLETNNTTETNENAIVGKYGGTLIINNGQGIPGAGRKPNPFRKWIRELADGDKEIILKGKLLGEDGTPTTEVVEVLVTLPGALAVAIKAYKMAVKGDGQARKWLTDTGWDKSINLDIETGGTGGFAVILPSNNRDK